MAGDRPGTWAALRQAAQALRREVMVMYLAMRHPMTPWYAKALAAAVVVYALSPIDLIPDPIPVLGHLDDLLIVPLGVLLVRRSLPPSVVSECRQAAAEGVRAPAGWRWAGGLLVVSVWAACAWLIVRALTA